MAQLKKQKKDLGEQIVTLCRRLAAGVDEGVDTPAPGKGRSAMQAFWPYLATTHLLHHL